MRSIAIPILVAAIFLVMVVYLVTFQVRETESAFVTRFGKPVRQETTPGLYRKWPTPIEQVHKFDSRMRVLEAEFAETTTSGTVPIIVNTYVVWRVKEPLKFLNAVKTIENAEAKLRTQITDTQNRVIGQHAFGEFVNSDPGQIQFDQIQEQMLADLKGPALKDYGIEIKTLGIKQLKISADVTKQVFERMKAERQRRTDATISEGGAEAERIRSEANAKRDVLLAAAEARAKAIRGQGDAEAAKYYKMLDEEPQLAMFLRNLDALALTLKERATVFLRADVDPFRLLTGMPSLEPNKPARKP
jgi:modulator of FtsH protease HflC